MRTWTIVLASFALCSVVGVGIVYALLVGIRIMSECENDRLAYLPLNLSAESICEDVALYMHHTPEEEISLLDCLAGLAALTPNGGIVDLAARAHDRVVVEFGKYTSDTCSISQHTTNHEIGSSNMSVSAAFTGVEYAMATETCGEIEAALVPQFQASTFQSTKGGSLHVERAVGSSGFQYEAGHPVTVTCQPALADVTSALTAQTAQVCSGLGKTMSHFEEEDINSRSLPGTEHAIACQAASGDVTSACLGRVHLERLNMMKEENDDPRRLHETEHTIACQAASADVTSACLGRVHFERQNMMNRFGEGNDAPRILHETEHTIACQAASADVPNACMVRVHSEQENTMSQFGDENNDSRSQRWSTTGGRSE